jgi:hypothetical protein
MVLINRSTGTGDWDYDLQKKNVARVIRMIGSEPMRRPRSGISLSRRLPWDRRQTIPCDPYNKVVAQFSQREFRSSDRQQFSVK